MQSLFKLKISQLGFVNENFLLSFKPEDLSLSTDTYFTAMKRKQFWN